ncbi:MAG: iron-containing alcohol dehydrogenase family protein [Lachnospiraceae bacterium]|nr:iron-containing alcohol dehydrogenase family protein [Lachnospiraceae bacterium]
MKLENYEMHLPSYSIGSECYNKIPGVCKDYGKKILVIGGEKGIGSAIDKIRAAIAKTELEIIGEEIYGKDCTYKAVERLRALPQYQEADMVFAIGGGKALDTCKCLCIDDDKPIFTFPTIASNCAATTSVSIMYNEDGTFLKPHFFIRPAMHAFIDTEVIAKSPAVYMWAGIGDTYAKYYEATISSIDENLEHYTALGVNVSQMCKEPILKYGKKAYEDQLNGRSSYELEQIVLAIVVTTGIASIFLTRDFTPDYNSGLAHGIFYALTRYPVIEEKHYHGEVVGFGILFALLCDQNEEEFEKIYSFNKSIGLPVKLEDIEITEEQFRQILPELPTMSDVRHYPYAITVEMMEAAWKKLNERVAKDSNM